MGIYSPTSKKKAVTFQQLGFFFPTYHCVAGDAISDSRRNKTKIAEGRVASKTAAKNLPAPQSQKKT